MTSAANELDWVGEVPVWRANFQLVGYLERSSDHPHAIMIRSADRAVVGWVYLPAPGRIRLVSAVASTALDEVVSIAYSWGVFSGHWNGRRSAI